MLTIANSVSCKNDSWLKSTHSPNVCLKLPLCVNCCQKRLTKLRTLSDLLSTAAPIRHGVHDRGSSLRSWTALTRVRVGANEFISDHWLPIPQPAARIKSPLCLWRAGLWPKSDVSAWSLILFRVVTARCEPFPATFPRLPRQEILVDHPTIEQTETSSLGRVGMGRA